MSLINTYYASNMHGTEAIDVQNHNMLVSNVGNKEEDESKKNTLENDVVTLSDKTLSSNNQDLFSSNRSKALAAYKKYSLPVEEAAEKISEDLKLPNQEDDETKNTDETKEISSDDDKENKSESEVDPEDKKPNGEELTDDEKRRLENLKDRDAEVKTHEKAHQNAGGQYAGAPVYEYEKGPDGKNYATGGHVNIDVSEEKTPEATIQKMKIVIKAALAPQQPSGQDLKVASQAQQTLNEAQMQKMNEQKEENKSDKVKEDESTVTNDDISQKDSTAGKNPDESLSSKMN